MPRGRRAKPAEVKALLGNPGKRKLALQGRGKGAAAPAITVKPPDYLTQQRERDVFVWALEYLPANIVRNTDVHALARWSTWLNTWVTCKLALDGKQHWYTTRSNFGEGKAPLEIHREHPLAKRMDKAEAHLVTLEDRLCLNIVARNNVMHRILNAPPAHPGAGLFADEPATEDEKNGKTDAPPPAAMDDDPLGYLQRAGKPLN